MKDIYTIIRKKHDLKNGWNWQIIISTEAIFVGGWLAIEVIKIQLLQGGLAYELFIHVIMFNAGWYSLGDVMYIRSK